MKWLVASLGAVSAACTPVARYTPQPLLLPPATPAERCYHEQRLSLAGSDEITIFRGHGPIPAEEAVDLLQDMELRATYHRRVSEAKSAAGSYRRNRGATIGLAVGGLVLSGIGLYAAAHDSSPGAVLFYGGLAMVVASVFTGVIAASQYDDAVEYEQRRAVFSSPAWVPRLRAAARRHNDEAAAKCGHPRSDLPGVD